jgi:hypothetical protein
MKKLLVMLMATLCVASVWAAEPAAKSKSDEPVAKVADLTGLVTVSRSNTMGNAIKDTPLKNGDQVATAASSTALIRFKDGCDIKLEPQQAVKIDEGDACAAIVWSTGGAPVVAAGGGLGPALVGVGVGIALMPKLSGR